MSGLGKSGIPYCTHTWSPIRGCLGCEVGSACWALRTCWRAAHNPNPKVAAQFEGLVERGCGGCHELNGDADCNPISIGHPCAPEECPKGTLQWTDEIRTYPEVFDAPLRRRKPAVIFVCPQGDLAHADEGTVRAVFNTAALAVQHQFLFLTKWPELLLGKLYEDKEYECRGVAYGPVPRGLSCVDHLWLGVSATDQRTYDERVGVLCHPETGWPGNKLVSLEPCMGEVYLNLHRMGPGDVSGVYNNLGWVIAGSHNRLPEAAAFTPDIALSLRDQCEAAGVPYWLKQMPIAHWVEKSPLLDGHRHNESPAPIASILREERKP